MKESVQYLSLMRKSISYPYNQDMRLLKRLFFILILAFSVLTAASQSATFTYRSDDGLYCTPSIVNFTSTVTGTPSGYSWNFGNGSFSNSSNPSVVYSAPGTYTVTLVAIYENTTTQSSQTLTINPAVTVNLTVDRPYICKPGDINFTTNFTGNITDYLYDFGDGSPAISSPGNTITHLYSSFGTYTAKVTATSSFGCTATSTITVSVRIPSLVGTASPALGCIPALVSFNSSVILPIGGSVTKYNWNFDDGNTQVTVGSSTNHSYNKVGSFVPTLDITTNEGCTANYTFPKIAFGTPPTGIVAYSPKPIICGSKMATLIANAKTANSYEWDFGDGVKQTVDDTITTHKYTVLGTYNVSVIPYFNGCPGPSASFTVEVIGVIVGYSYNNTCANKNVYSFNNISQGNVSTYLWTFGDGTPSASTANVIHSYPTPGIFPTKLFIVDSITGCTDELEVNIYTATPSVVNADVAICRYSASTFNINNNYQNPSNTYNWVVLGQNFTNQTAPSTFNADTLGLFSTNFVVINYDNQSCPDTISLDHPILVRGPKLDFTIPTSVCATSPITFTNKSKPFIPGDSIILYYWNYGIVSRNDTTILPSPQSFTNAGVYPIKLIGIDINGCKDSLIKTLTVNPLPYLKVVPQRDTLCLGEQSTLVAFHTDTLSWNNAATLSCANCDTTIAKPSITTNYVATARSVFGCVSTDTSRVLVYHPFTAAITANTNILCAGDSVQLNAAPFGKIITWSPAIAITDITSYNPVVKPPSNTLYVAQLADSVGCFTSSASINIIVKTLPTVNAGPDLILPYASTVTLTPVYSANVSNFLWTPATNLSCNNCATPVLNALNTQLYLITVFSDSGCVARDTVKVTVECKEGNVYLPSAFTPNGDGRNDYFYPLTRGTSLITKFVIYNRYGNVVFSRANFAPNVATLGWNGKFGNVPQDQTGYVYVIEFICDQGQKLVKKGSFLLLH